MTTDKPDPDAPEVLSAKQAASYLGCSREHLARLRIRGTGPKFAKLGKMIRYRKTEIDKWLDEHERTQLSEVK